MCDFFFFTQQFIIWHMRADHDSDYVAIYMQSDLTWKYKRRDRKRKERKRKEKIEKKSEEQMCDIVLTPNSKSKKIK